VIFLEHEVLYGKSFDMNNDIDYLPLNKAIIMREGSDLTITSFSISVEHAMQASQILHEEFGIEAEVVNLISLRPIDEDTIIRSLTKTGRIINVEEGWGTCGIGSEIISIVSEKAFDYLDAEPTKIHSAEVPMPYSKNLEQMALPKIEEIVQTARKLCNR
jgi:pyruvate dehydrogenase E1 component beta subunit